jgi:hypothetical protein
MFIASKHTLRPRAQGAPADEACAILVVMMFGATQMNTDEMPGSGMSALQAERLLHFDEACAVSSRHCASLYDRSAACEHRCQHNILRTRRT